MFMKAASATIKIDTASHAETAKNTKLDDSIACCLASDRPSLLQRVLVGISGLGMLVAGPCLLILNLDDQGWSWASALVITWVGMTLLLLLGHSGCRPPEEFRIKENAAFTTAHEANDPSPLIETIEVDPVLRPGLREVKP